MTSAIFGLAGVIVGGLLTALGNFLLAYRVERGKAFAAARLVHHELGTIKSFLAVTTEYGAWAGEPNVELRTPVWNESKAAIAAAPRFDGWYAVSGALDNVENFARRIYLMKPKPRMNGPIDHIPEDHVVLLMLGIDVAEEALAAYAKTKTYKSETVKELQRHINRMNGFDDEDSTDDGMDASSDLEPR